MTRSSAETAGAASPRATARRIAGALVLLFLGLPEPETAAAAERDTVRNSPAGVIQLDETVISGNQELPKVLYIVPWQQPEGLPEIELRTDFAEVDLFRRLYPPAYRRELTYFEAAEAARAVPAERDPKE